jgi:Transmembrane secretion effector
MSDLHLTPPTSAPAVRRAPGNPFRTLLVHRNFRLFWTGQTLSLTGTWMQTMARGWLALQLSNSAFVVGLIGAVGSLPILLFSFSAGELADRTDKLRLVELAQALLLLEAALLWYLTWTGRVTVGWLLGLSAASGLFSAFEIPARQAMMVDLVGRDDLHEAIALNSSGFNVARILGPSAGAAVIASLGLAWCFALNAVSYVAVLVGLFMIRLPAFVRPAEKRNAWAGVREGVRYMWTTREVRVVMGLVAASTVLCVPFLTLMPVFARDRLGADADARQQRAVGAVPGRDGGTRAARLAARGVDVRPARAPRPVRLRHQRGAGDGRAAVRRLRHDPRRRPLERHPAGPRPGRDARAADERVLVRRRRPGGGRQPGRWQGRDRGRLGLDDRRGRGAHARLRRGGLPRPSGPRGTRMRPRP